MPIMLEYMLLVLSFYIISVPLIEYIISLQKRHYLDFEHIFQ